MINKSIQEECKSVQDVGSDYLENRLPKNARAVVAKHIGKCSRCESLIADLGITIKLLGELHSEVPSEPAIEKVLKTYTDYFPEPLEPCREHDWATAKKLWSELACLPDDLVLRTIRDEPRFHSLPLFDWLRLRARRVSQNEPDRALLMAKVSLEIARLFGGSPEKAEELHFQALDCLAWCLLLLREYRASSAVLEKLEELSARRVISLEARKSFLSTRGYLYSQTGQFERAERDLEEVLTLQRETKAERKKIIFSLVNLASANFTSGEPRRASELLLEAMVLIDWRKDPPRLQLIVCSYLMLAYCESNRPEKARELMKRTRRLSEAVGGWYRHLYMEWLSGTLARVEGRYKEAEAVFESVRSEFGERGHLAWYVEASLDLARAYLEQRKLGPLEQLAAELREELGHCADQRVSAAVACFADAVNAGTLSARLVKSLVVAVGSGWMVKRQL